MGYTPNLVTGVWVGNADNTPMVEVSGDQRRGADLARVHAARAAAASRSWRSPSRRDWCAPRCARFPACCRPNTAPRHAGNGSSRGRCPTERDTFYQPFTLDRRTGLLADDTTPPDDREERVYLMLPPEARDWAIRQGIPQPPVGARTVGGESIPARLLSPDPYTVFRLTPLVPEDQQRIRLAVAVPSHAEEVAYWLDGDLLATVEEPPFEHWWPLHPGEHEVTAVIALADGTRVTTDAVPFRVGTWIPPEERPHSGPAE